jgi:dienelactone hydrolase
MLQAPVDSGGSALAGFTPFRFAAGELSYTVFHAGDPRDAPLLLMPEIAGVSPGLLLFAQRLMESGFQIYLPWLFGPLGQRAPVRNALRLCVSREFANLRAGVSAPVTTWLRALAAEISERNGGRLVGAIGMCLTGAFAIPLVIDPKVVAAVAAQPAVPLSPLFTVLGIDTGRQRLGQLNVSERDIAEARARLEAGDAHLLAVRCRADRISPPAKLQTLREAFPVGLDVREYGEPGDRNRLGDRPHATFTKEYRLEPDAPANHHSRQAFSDLVAFFDRHLRKARK